MPKNKRANPKRPVKVYETIPVKPKRFVTVRRGIDIEVKDGQTPAEAIAHFLELESKRGIKPMKKRP